MSRFLPGINAFVLCFFLSLTGPLAGAEKVSSLNNFIQSIDEIVRHDSDYQAKKSEIEARQEELAPLKGSVLPILSAAAKRQISSVGDSQLSPSTVLGARAELNLYAFGRDVARWDEHGARAEQLARELQIAYLEAEGRAALQLFSLWQATDEVALTERLRRMRAHLAEIAGHQYNRGLLANQDRQKIELDLDATRLNELEALQKRDQAQATLRLSLNQQNPGQAWPSSNGLSDSSLAWLKVWDDKTQAEIIQKHPRILAARADQEAQSAKTREARSSLLPTLDFVSEYERVLGESSHRSRRMAHGVALNIPILEGLRSSSEYNAQQKKESAASLRLDTVRRDIALGLRNDVNKIVRDAEALRDRSRFVEKARAIYEANLARFERGLVSVNDLSIDESRLYGFERERNEGLAQFHRALLSFCQSAGWDLKACLGKVYPEL